MDLHNANLCYSRIHYIMWWYNHYLCIISLITSTPSSKIVRIKYYMFNMSKGNVNYKVYMKHEFLQQSKMKL